LPTTRRGASPNSCPGTGNRSKPPAPPPEPARSPNAYSAEANCSENQPTHKPAAIPKTLRNQRDFAGFSVIRRNAAYTYPQQWRCMRSAVRSRLAPPIKMKDLADSFAKPFSLSEAPRSPRLLENCFASAARAFATAGTCPSLFNVLASARPGTVRLSMSAGNPSETRRKPLREG
jgi:hypothetical protein